MTFQIITGIYDRMLLAANKIDTSSTSSAASLLPPRWKVALWEKNSIEPAMLRVPIVVIVFLFLWGLNIWFLERLRIQYHGVLSIKTVPLTFIFIVATILACTYALCMTLVTSILGFTVETGVLSFYAILVLLLFMPILPGQDNMASFFRLSKQVLIPGSSISFPEVLYADALTSMSKVLKDLGVSLIAIYAQTSGTSVVELHDVGMLSVAVLASLPFWIRIRQCWVQLDGTNDNISKIPITLNLLKYFSAFPPIWLSAVASFGFFHPDLPLITAVMATINSIYSFLWDVCMDWGLIQFSRDGRVYGRQRMLLPWICYGPVVIINLLLRFSWAANRIPSFSHLHASHLVLMVELGEVFRRAMWNIFRIEWEVLVQHQRALSAQNVKALEDDDQKKQVKH